MGQEPKPQDRLEGLIQRGLRWFQGGISTTVRAVLFGVPVGVILRDGTGAPQSGSIVGWVIVGVAAALVGGGFLAAWCSRARRERDQFRSERDEFAKLVQEDADELVEKTEDASRLEAENEARRAYGATEREVVDGLAEGARRASDNPDYDVDRLVEGNSLERINDVFTAQLGPHQAGKTRFESGIVHRDESGVYVTHASGRSTQRYKDKAPCWALERDEIRQLLSRRARVDFSDGVAFVAPLGRRDGNEWYFFALSTAPLGEAELDSLRMHAALIEQTFDTVGRMTFRAADGIA